MENKKTLSQIVAENITKLRKNKGLTQTQFAEKINYSDNTVSRWEHGEISPSLETLEQISSLFNVSIDYLVHEHISDETIQMGLPLTRKVKHLQTTLMLVALIWLVAIIAYFHAITFFKVNIWTVFVWAVPASCIAMLTYSKYAVHRAYFFVFASIAIWTMLTALYIQFLSYNLFLIFIIGIPLEYLLAIWTFVRPKPKRKK
ncbi:MAG: helix-turn-helix transcriptional regulator [Clostridia bacterium]|nr:helix-turn-helix transcriptional regulator [Clostridia bacterium]